MLTLLLTMVDTPEKAEVLTRLYEKYEKKIYAAAFRVLGSRLDAEEITLETFEYLIRRWDTLDLSNDKGVKVFLFEVATHKALDLRKKQGHTESLEDHPTLAAADTPHTTLEGAENVARLASFIDKLPDEEREAMLLSFSIGLPVREIADLLGKPKSTVYHALSRAKGKVLTYLREENRV